MVDSVRVYAIKTVVPKVQRLRGPPRDLRSSHGHPVILTAFQRGYSLIMRWRAGSISQDLNTVMVKMQVFSLGLWMISM